MAVCEMHFGSEALQKQASMTVIVPENVKEPFPVVYLLHGLSDDHTGWVRRTSVERYVRDYPLMVVMPNGDRGWYTDAAANPYAAYETFIVRDVVGFIDSTFRTKAAREGRAISGQSMGGYGALKLALKHPETFCAGASLSGAVHVPTVLEMAEDRKREMQLIYGDSFDGCVEDLAAIASNANTSSLPSLWMDCGTEDFLIEGNRRMHRHLRSLGVHHHYQENPGNHSWDYWDGAIQDALVFLRRELGIE